MTDYNFEDPEKIIAGFRAIPPEPSLIDRIFGRSPKAPAPPPEAPAFDFENPDKTISSFAEPATGITDAEAPSVLQRISLPQPPADGPSLPPGGALSPDAAAGAGSPPSPAPAITPTGAVGEMARTLENVGLVYPAAETAASLFSNLYALPASGLAGLAALMPGDANRMDRLQEAATLGLVDESALVPDPARGAKAQEAVYNLTAFQPQTERGRELTETVMLPFELLQRGAGAAGEKTLEATGSPAAATAVHTAIEGLPALIARGRAKRMAEAVKNSDWYRSATIRERGLVVQSLAETLEKNPKLKEADLVRRSEQYYKEAKQRRSRPEAQAEAKTGAATETPKAAPDLKTDLARAFKTELETEAAPRPLSGLRQAEAAPVAPTPPTPAPTPQDIPPALPPDGTIPLPPPAPALPAPSAGLPEGQGFEMVGRPYGETGNRPIVPQEQGSPPMLPPPESPGAEAPGNVRAGRGAEEIRESRISEGEVQRTAEVGEPGREPWEMTRGEWESEYANARPDIAQNKFTKNSASETIAKFNRAEALRYGAKDHITEKLEAHRKGDLELSPEEVEVLLDEINTPILHRDVIAKAVREGKPVPPEVLAEYPELARQEAAPQETPGAEAPGNVRAKMAAEETPPAEVIRESRTTETELPTNIFALRKMAREQGIDVSDIKGKGAADRIRQRLTEPAVAPASSPAPVAREAAAAKEPWEMTRDEFRQRPSRYSVDDSLDVAGRNLAGEITLKRPGMATYWHEVAHNYINSSSKSPELSPLLRNAFDKEGDIVRRTRKSWSDIDEIAPDVYAAFKNGEIEFIPESKRREWAKVVDAIDGEIDAHHRYIIGKALSEGKPVPPEVLAEYPELVRREAAAQETPGAEAPGNVRAGRAAEETAGREPGPVPLKQAEAETRTVTEADGDVVVEAPADVSLSPKDQKAWLLDQVKRQKKIVAEEDPESVQFKVPGDGEFQIYNPKENLAEFEKNVRTKFPAAPSKAPSRNAPAGRPTGKRVVPYWGTVRGEYSPVKQKEPPKPTDQVAYDDGFYSDNAYLIRLKSRPKVPKGITYRETKAPFADIVKKFNKDLAPVERMEYIGVGDPAGYAKVHGVERPWGSRETVDLKATAGDSVAYFNPEYFDHILTEYPKAKVFLTPNGEAAMFKSGPSVVGMVMAREGRAEAIPEHIQDLKAVFNIGQGANEAGSLNPGAETPPASAGVEPGATATGGGATLYSGIPLDLALKPLGAAMRAYEAHVGTPLWDFFSETVPRKFGDLHPVLDAVNRGIIQDYKKSPEWVALRKDAEKRIAEYREVSRELADALKQMPRAHQVRAAQIIRGGITGAPKFYARAFEAAERFKELETKLTDLGILRDTRFRQLSKKELAAKRGEIAEIDREIESLRQARQPMVQKQVRETAKEVADAVTETVTSGGAGGTTAKAGKQYPINEARVKEALTARGFASGEADLMIQRIKDSVAGADPAADVREIRTTIHNTVTRTIEREILTEKTYSRRFMARARGSIDKSIRELEKKRGDLQGRIQTHYKMAGRQYLRKAYRTIEEQKGFLDDIRKYFKRPRMKKDYTIRRRDLAPLYREKLGEIQEAPYLVYKGLSHEYHDMVLMETFNRISKNPQWAVSPKTFDAAPEDYPGFKPLPASDKLGPLAGWFVDKYIWDDLNQAAEVRSDFMRAYDGLLRGWKTGKVVFNPASHARNAMANTVMADLAGLQPHRVDIYAAAAGALRDPANVWRKEIDTTPLLRNTWFGAEAMRFLEDAKNLKSAEGMQAKLANAFGRMMEKPGELYQLNEKFFKTALFIHFRKQGMDVNKAYLEAEKWLFNYEEIPKAIRWAKRWYSPFVTWSYKAAPRMAEAAVKRPWKYAKYLVGMLAVEELTRRMNGESEEAVEREKRVLPEYMRRSVLPGQFNHLRVPYQDKFGRSKYLDLSYILPWGDVGEQWGQSRVGFRSFLPGHPVWTMAAEVVFNEVLFTGQELTDKELDGAGEYAKKIGGEIWRQMAPTLAPGGYGFNKLVTAVTGEKDWAGRDRSVAEAVFDTLLGLKVRSIDYSEEMARRMSELRDAQNRLRRKFAGEYNRLTFRTPNMSPGKRRVKVQQLTEQTQRDMNKLFERAQFYAGN